MLPAGTGVLFRARHGCKEEGVNADKETSTKFQSFLRAKSLGVNNCARKVIEAAVLEMFELDRAELGGDYIPGSKFCLALVGCTGWSSPWEVNGRL